DGRVSPCPNPQGGHPHQSGNEIADVEGRPLLAKRHPDSPRAYCSSGGIDPLESAQQEVVKCTKPRLDRWRRKWKGRNQARRTVVGKSFSCSGRTNAAEIG